GRVRRRTGPSSTGEDERPTMGENRRPRGRYPRGGRFRLRGRRVHRSRRTADPQAEVSPGNDLVTTSPAGPLECQTTNPPANGDGRSREGRRRVVGDERRWTSRTSLRWRLAFITTAIVALIVCPGAL